MILEQAAPVLLRKYKFGSHTAKVFHGARGIEQDPQFELDMAARLRKQLSREQLHEACSLHAIGVSYRAIGRRKKLDIERIPASGRS